MKVARSVAEVLAEHTTLTVECIDRMYLNVYVPLLQRAAGAAYFFRKMRGAAVPSSVLMAVMTRRFVEAIERYAERNGISIVTFRRGERKDDRTQERLRDWSGGEGSSTSARPRRRRGWCAPSAATTPPAAPPTRGWSTRPRWSTTTTKGLPKVPSLARSPPYSLAIPQWSTDQETPLTA